MSNSQTAFGPIVFIGPTEQKTDRYRGRSLVIKTDANSNYPQEICFQLSNDRCALADNLQPGQIVTVHYNLRGRRWEKDGKTAWFNTLDAWRIEAQQQSGTTGQPEPATPQQKEVEGDLSF